MGKFEEYKEKVDTLTEDILKVIAMEDGKPSPCSLDALNRVTTFLLAGFIANHDRTKEQLKIPVEKHISFLASVASKAFEEKFGETLFGMSSQVEKK